ncbi:hypothetical protein SAMN05660489_04349 [Pseudomonas sp. LAMO17WK12:I10]|uniref:hypothetical protein n=1 Tax=unclassified Pseudomonas TaxID=196821 RepID=UPI000BDC7315|nr:MULTISPECIES: hypothetical protein [unclassified Pseudomonas]PXX60726.1 hypothetical protein H160_04402 [Pseudomonas sp. LAMO17WK12:I9]SNY45360.1 hypothetical protein SAMN05660489_04349 [Pseudomonas sp. LAMO17WK12:I10]
MNRPAYGTPEYEEWCRINSNCAKVTGWGKEQMAKIVCMDDRNARVSAFNNMANYLSNLHNMVREVAAGSYVHFCTNCGKPECAHYVEPKASQLKANGLCHNCDFWHEKRTTYNAQARAGRMLVMKGWVYGDSGDQPGGNSSWLGFGGSRWYLYQITTGKLWTTNNLFSAGDIPADFLPGMPDNAVALTKEQFELAQAGR